MTIFYQIESVFVEVFIAFLPMVVVFAAFQVAFLKMPMPKFLRLMRSMVVAFLGMVLFIQGVNMAFLSSGEILGTLLAKGNAFFLIVIGFFLGVLVTTAEPAVKVLTIEIQKETSGYIKETLFVSFLALGVGLSIAFALTRVLLDIPFLMVIVVLYGVIVLLTIKASETFTALAFDSGGVVTGPMIATFIMAFTVSAADTLGGDPVKDGFGMIALVAAVPILMILVLGHIYESND